MCSIFGAVSDKNSGRCEIAASEAIKPQFPMLPCLKLLNETALL